MPVTFQIQPPKSAIRMLVAWFTDMPVERIAVISS
jgi:hypothetical protein